MKAASFAFYVIFSVAGLGLLRYFLPLFVPFGANQKSVLGWVVLGGFLYLASFAVWLQIIRTIPLSTAYPLAIGLTLCGTTLVSRLWLHENLSGAKTAGIGLIMAGVLLIARNS